MRERVYHGLSLDCDIADGEITEISLVDRPFEKVSGAQDRVLAKIYDGKEVAMTPLASALRKFENPGMPGHPPVRLTPAERAALLNFPPLAERVAQLERIELGTGDAKKQARANE